MDDFTPMFEYIEAHIEDKLDLKELSDIPVWYADYEAVPQTPYDFVMWQYSESIHVPGIPGNMDGNILLIPAE